MKNFFNKLVNKFKTFSLYDWIEFCLWTLTLIFLFLVVILAASIKPSYDAPDKDFVQYYNVLAGVIGSFVLLLFSSIFYTVGRKFNQKRLRNQKTNLESEKA